MTPVYEPPKNHKNIDTCNHLRVNYTKEWLNYYSVIHNRESKTVSVRLPPRAGKDELGYRVSCAEPVVKPERIAHAALFEIN